MDGARLVIVEGAVDVHDAARLDEPAVGAEVVVAVREQPVGCRRGDPPVAVDRDLAGGQDEVVVAAGPHETHSRHHAILNIVDTPIAFDGASIFAFTLENAAFIEEVGSRGASGVLGDRQALVTMPILIETVGFSVDLRPHDTNLRSVVAIEAGAVIVLHASPVVVPDAGNQTARLLKGIGDRAVV